MGRFLKCRIAATRGGIDLCEAVGGVVHLPTEGSPKRSHDWAQRLGRGATASSRQLSRGREVNNSGQAVRAGVTSTSHPNLDVCFWLKLSSSSTLTRGTARNPGRRGRLRKQSEWHQVPPLLSHGKRIETGHGLNPRGPILSLPGSHLALR